MAGFIRYSFSAMPVRRMQQHKLPGDLLDESLRAVELRREGDVVLTATMNDDRIIQHHRFTPAYRQNDQGNNGD